MSLRMSPKDMPRLRVVTLANIHESIRHHFTREKHNAFQYRFNFGIKEEDLEKRKDIFALMKMAKRLQNTDNAIEYCVSNVIAGETWFPLFTEDNLLEYQKGIQALGYTIQKDCEKLSELSDLDSCLTSNNSDYPLIVHKQLEGTISFLTVVVLHKLTGFLDDANRRIKETLLWPDLYLRYKKCGHFVIFDEPRVKEIIVDSFMKKFELPKSLISK